MKITTTKTTRLKLTRSLMASACQVGLIFVLTVTLSPATIYTYQDENGQTHLTNIRPSKDKNAQIPVDRFGEDLWRGCFSAPGGCKKAQTQSYAGVDTQWQNMPLNSKPYAKEIALAAKTYQVDEELIRSIIQAESAFDPFAISSAGAQGLMQLMPATQKRFKVKNAFNAQQNINGGTQYLAFLLKLFDDQTELVAAAYNAGENAVKKYDGIPPYAETQLYVKRVNNLYRRYKKK